MNRKLLVPALVVVLVVAFVALRPSGDDDRRAPRATPAPSAGASAGKRPAATATPAPRPKPEILTIRVEGLAPVGGVRDITVEKGDRLRFDVRSDQAENIHLHGYDVEKPVGPGEVASFSLRADLEGIFEVELEESAVPIAEVTVNP